MNKQKLSPALLLFAATMFSGAFAHAASMTLQSLSGPVTATEISSYKTFMGGRTPPTANTYDNNMADGTAGTDCESLGLMYEVSHDTQILDKMIQFADAFLWLRNNTNTGQIMWTGQREAVWLTKATNSTEAGYAGCENNDIAGHIAHCAKLILQTPAIWNTTVAVGDPHGYGTTYLQRAQTYVTQMDFTQDTYMVPHFVDAVSHRITAPTASAWTAFGESVNAWNRHHVHERFPTPLGMPCVDG